MSFIHFFNSFFYGLGNFFTILILTSKPTSKKGSQYSKNCQNYFHHIAHKTT